MGRGLRTAQQLPSQLPWASPRKQACLEPSTSVSAQCSGRTPAPGERETAEAEPGGVAGDICLRTSLPAGSRGPAAESG